MNKQEDSRLQSFFFYWRTWFKRYGPADGMQVIYYSDSQKSECVCYVNGEKYVVDISGREEEFVKALYDCKLPDWNKKDYVSLSFLDGHEWAIQANFDGILIETTGDNAFPPEFPEFLKFFRVKWGLPKCQFETDDYMRVAIETAEVLTLEKMYIAERKWLEQ